MALAKEDRKYISDQLRDLVARFSQIFPTKIEVKEMVNESLVEVKDILSRLEDTAAFILHRLDVEQLPFIEKH